MAFTLDTWKTKLPERFQNWRQRMAEFGVDSVYASLCAMTLWPVAQAATGGGMTEWIAVGGVLAGVGANLVANRVQGWKDEADAARDIAAEAAKSPAFRAGLDAMLDKLDVVAIARAALPENKRAWLDEALRQERQQYGTNSSTVTATATDHSVAVGGDAHGPITITGGKKGE